MVTEEPIDMEIKAKDDVKSDSNVAKEIMPEQLVKEEATQLDSSAKVEIETESEAKNDESDVKDIKSEAKDVESDEKAKSESVSHASDEASNENENVTKQEEVSPLERKIIRQIEYYFGNYNLFADRFLREQVNTNDGGWVEMETMMKFNRLKEFSTDSAFVVAALRKSTTGLMEINDDGTKIRRTLLRPIPQTYEAQKKDIDERTVYVKGFAVQASLDELLDYFQPFQNPENVLMRRRNNKKFKGSVFVTFLTKEDADTFMKLKEVKYKGKDLLKEMKLDYTKRKSEWFEQMQKEKAEKKKTRTENKETKMEEETEDKELEESKKGCLLKLVALAEGTMWEDIKKVLSPHGTVAYVDYSRGQPEATVRFESGVSAADVLKAVATEADGKTIIKINDADAVGSVIEGEEEAEYWKSFTRSKSQRGGGRGGKRGGRFGGRGRGGFYGKRKQGNFRGDGPNKRMKTNGAGD